MNSFFRCILRAVRLLPLAGAAILMPGGAAGEVCGKQCRQARDYCKAWERDHPGETCGQVRGAVCIGKSWKKIKQVNALWSACQLVRGSDDHAGAQARCDEYKANWGGTCQVHSPLCNAGWAALGTYGKFRACRPREVSGDLLYDGYKAYMRKWEGRASTPLPAHLHFFIKREYGIDPDWVRWGTVSDTSNSTCITDCNRIYCDAAFPEQRVREGYNLHLNGGGGVTDLLFHELTHVQQCKNVGGRRDYAHLWFSNLNKGLGRAIRDGGRISAAEIHDFQPMEQNAAAKGGEVRERYVAEWWHTAARCRVYLPDRRTVGYVSNNTHPRAFCDPQVGWQGSKDLRARAAELAKKHGEGVYHIAFGLPHEGNGVWLGEVEIKHKVVEASIGVSVSGETCPKPAKLRVLLATEGPRKVRLRYRIGQDWSGWRQVEAKAASLVSGGGGGYLAVFEHTPSRHLGPGVHKAEVEIAGYKTLVRQVKVACPPFAALSAKYAVRVAPGAFCPREVTELVTFETNGPGTVRFGFRSKGAGKLVTSDRYRAKAKRDGNAYIASFQATSSITDDFSLTRRVETLGKAPVHSRWRTMEIACLDISQSAIIYDGPDAGTCRYQTGVKVRVNADMAADLPYRLDCADGQSATGTFAIRQTGPGTFIGVDTLKLNVTKAGKQICALKADLGAGLRTLTLQGNDFECSAATPPGGAGLAGSAPADRPSAPTAVPPPGRPLPGIACAGGSVRAGACRCPQGLKPVRAGRRSFRCVRQATAPVRKVACAGGKVRAGRCHCPRGTALSGGVCRKPAPKRSGGTSAPRAR